MTGAAWICVGLVLLLRDRRQLAPGVPPTGGVTRASWTITHFGPWHYSARTARARFRTHHCRSRQARPIRKAAHNL